jgi:hypothetical protein
MSTSAKPDLLKMMEDTANTVAALTGAKAQFVAAGWSEPAAEQMVIEFVRQSGPARQQ